MSTSNKFWKRECFDGFFLLVTQAMVFLHLLLQIGQPELIALEKALKVAMSPVGSAREVTAYSYFGSLRGLLLSEVYMKVSLTL